MIGVLRTRHGPQMALAFCGRLVGSMPSECLEYILILGELHPQRVTTGYLDYFNNVRPQ